VHEHREGVGEQAEKLQERDCDVRRKEQPRARLRDTPEPQRLSVCLRAGGFGRAAVR
jgi:hypothetical protein